MSSWPCASAASRRASSASSSRSSTGGPSSCPIGRVTSADGDAVVLGTGTVNLRRFDTRPGETLVLAELLDRKVTIVDTGAQATVLDAAMEQGRNRDWHLTRVAVQVAGKGIRRREPLRQLKWEEVEGLSLPEDSQGAANMLAAFEKLRPPTSPTSCTTCRASAATRSPPPSTTSGSPTSSRSCPRTTRSRSSPGSRRSAPPTSSRRWARTTPPTCSPSCPPPTPSGCSSSWSPTRPRPYAGCSSYAEDTAGGLMTSEPVILPPNATVAEALARVRDPDLTPALAARSTSAGRRPRRRPGAILGIAHIQRLLREPPSTLVGSASSTPTSTRCRPDSPLRTVTAHLATYNLVAVTGRRRGRPAARRGHASTTCSTTCCPRTGASSATQDGTAARWRVSRSCVARAARRRGPAAAAAARAPLPDYDPETFGRLSERVARFLGTWRFIGYMSFFIVGLDRLQHRAGHPPHFDQCGNKFTLLTLLLSLQASYAAPLILLAQNRQADRDRVQFDEDRALQRALVADTEYLTREIAVDPHRARRGRDPRLHPRRAAAHARGAGRAPRRGRRARVGVGPYGATVWPTGAGSPRPRRPRCSG